MSVGFEDSPIDLSLYSLDILMDTWIYSYTH